MLMAFFVSEHLICCTNPRFRSSPIRSGQNSPPAKWTPIYPMRVQKLMERRGRTRTGADLRGPDCFCPRAKTDEELRMPLKGAAHALLFSAPVPRQAQRRTISKTLLRWRLPRSGAENKHPKLLIGLCPRPSAFIRVENKIRISVTL